MRMSTVVSAALFAVGLALTVYNVPDVIQTVLRTPLTEGWATLIGTVLAAVLGAIAIGWQARLGLRSLQASREIQSGLDREARAHQAELDRQAREHQILLQKQHEAETSERDRRFLLSLIRGELVGYYNYLANSATTHRKAEIYFKSMPDTGKNNAFLSVNLEYDFPAYKHSIGIIGSLGVSIVADLARVYVIPDVTLENGKTYSNLTPDVASNWHGSVASTIESHMEEVHHVAMRLRAIDMGEEDPGTLAERRIESLRRKKMSAEPSSGGA